MSGNARSGIISIGTKKNSSYDMLNASFVVGTTCKSCGMALQLIMKYSF